MSEVYLSEKLKFETIKSVELLYRPKVGGLVAHAGVKFELESDIVVLHRTPENDTHLSTYQEFCEGSLPICKRYLTNGLEPIRTRALGLIERRKSYSVFDNCEHLASYLIDGVGKSSQLQGATTGLVVGAAAACMLGSKSKTTTVLAAVGVGLLFLAMQKDAALTENTTDALAF